MQWSVAPPDAQTQKIGNILDAPRILAEKIENLQQEIAQPKLRSTNRSPKTRRRVTEGRKSDRGLYSLEGENRGAGAKKSAGEEAGKSSKKLIQELKTTQAETLKAVIRRKLDQLQKEAEVEKDKAELIEKQIESLTKLLGDLEKPTSARKSKKR